MKAGVKGGLLMQLGHPAMLPWSFTPQVLQAWPERRLQNAPGAAKFGVLFWTCLEGESVTVKLVWDESAGYLVQPTAGRPLTPGR